MSFLKSLNSVQWTLLRFSLWTPKQRQVATWTQGESFGKPETPQIAEDCYQAKGSKSDAQWLLRPYQGQPHPGIWSWNSCLDIDWSCFIRASEGQWMPSSSSHLSYQHVVQTHQLRVWWVLQVNMRKPVHITVAGNVLLDKMKNQVSPRHWDS